MKKRSFIDPEPLAQIVLVDFEPGNPDARDIYMAFDGYTLGYSPTPLVEAGTKGIDFEKDLTREQEKALAEVMHYYIKNPKGKLLRFDYEQYGGLKKIEPGSDPNAEKLNWIIYDQENFIEKDGAKEVTSYLLFENQGLYKIRKMALTRNIEEDYLIEKTASEEEVALFNDVFKYLIKNLYSHLEIHDTFSQAGGVAIFQWQKGGGFKQITSVEKNVLVKAGIKNAEAEGKYMNDYLERYARDNGIDRQELFFLPSTTQLLPEAFLKKLMVEEVKKDANGQEYPYKTIKVDTQNYGEALKTAEEALSQAFGSLLNKRTRKKNKTEYDVLQGKVARIDSFEQISNTTAQQPFIQRYEPDKTEFQRLKPLKHKVSSDSNDKTFFTYVDIKTGRELDYFHLLVLSAYKTWKKKYPGEPVTNLDLANMIHHSKGKRSSLDGNSQLVKDVGEALENLISSLGKIDFSRQAYAYSGNKNFRRYIENGGTGIITFPYISAVLGPVKTANGEILDGAIPDGEKADRLLDAYIAMTGQIRTITGEVFLTNPLKISRENEMIFHYLLYKVFSMPYFNSNVSLLNEKHRYLTLTGDLEPEPIKNEAEKKTIWKKPEQEPAPEADQEPGGAEALANSMLELEAKTHKKDLTIALDTFIEDLKLNKPNDTPARIKRRRNATKGKIEKILDYWKSNGLINGYTTNIKPNGRSIQSYTLSFFGSPQG